MRRCARRQAIRSWQTASVALAIVGAALALYAGALWLLCVDLSDLLTRAATQAGQRGTATKVTCQVEVATGLTVRVDPGQIRRAVDNLMDNALRFAPAGSQIVLSARADGQDVAIEVADAGPGFPVDYLSHAFERFSRPDSVRARTAGGAGLGLSIVMAIAQAHGGAAAVRNQPSGGAVVRIDMPGAVYSRA